MNKECLVFLRAYSSDVNKVNRLLVSAYLYSLQINSVQNTILKNLLIRPDEEDFQYLSKFLSLSTYADLEGLIEMFEFVISPEDKVVTGAIFTPPDIREFIASHCFSKVLVTVEETRICDMACGCGGFLLTAARKVRAITNQSYEEIFRKHIFGLDIKEYSVERTKILLTLLAVSEGEDKMNFVFNVFQGNALNFSWGDYITDFRGFHIILGNPPYVSSRHIDADTKALLQNWSVCSTGHPDLYIPFYQIGIENLATLGILGYITMNTFFKSVNGRALREYFRNAQLQIRIVDFGSIQVFPTKSTYTCICFVQTTLTPLVEYLQASKRALASIKREDLSTIPYDKLDDFNGWNLKNVSIVEKITSTGKPLGDIFRVSNGIATLKNKVYIFDPIDENEDYYFLYDSIRYPIEKAVCRDIINPNKLTVVSEIEPLRRKIIFPYIYHNDKAVIISELAFSENYPNAYAYLNSKRAILATRDKGNGNYEEWFAYGRNQNLDRFPFKLFFPHIAAQTPHYIISDDEGLLFHNGIAIIGKNRRDLLFVKKIMSSRLFWFYIKNTSKPYGSGFFSFSRNYIKSFGIPVFSDADYNYVIGENDIEKLNYFLEKKYDIQI